MQKESSVKIYRGIACEVMELNAMFLTDALVTKRRNENINK